MDFFLGIYADNNGYGLSVVGADSNSKVAILDSVYRNNFSINKLIQDINTVSDKYKGFAYAFINNLDTILRIINNRCNIYFKSKELNILDGITTLQGLLNDEVIEIHPDCKEKVLEEIQKFNLEEINHLLNSIFMCMEIDKYSWLTIISDKQTEHYGSILNRINHQNWHCIQEIKL